VKPVVITIKMEIKMRKALMILAALLLGWPAFAAPEQSSLTETNLAPEQN